MLVVHGKNRGINAFSRRADTTSTGSRGHGRNGVQSDRLFRVSAAISRDQLYRLATLPLRRQARGEVLRKALCGISVAIVGRIVRKEIVVDRPSDAIETLLLTLANGHFLHVSLSI